MLRMWIQRIVSAGKDWRHRMDWVLLCLDIINCEAVLLVSVLLLMFYSCKLNLFNCVNDYVVLYLKNTIATVDKMFI